MRCTSEGRPAPRSDARDEPGWGLAEVPRGYAALFIPQLAWRKRSGSPGRLRDAGFYRALMDRAARAAGERDPGSLRITVVAHSAGYETALAGLPHDPRIDEVLLLDALYGGAAEFAAWLGADPFRRVVSVHTGRGGPDRETRALAKRVRRTEGPGAVRSGSADALPAVLGPRLTVLRTAVKHRDIPRARLVPLLEALVQAREKATAAPVQ